MDTNIVFGALGSIQTSQACAANFFDGRRAEEWGTNDSATGEVQPSLLNTKLGDRFGVSVLVSTLPAQGWVSSVIMGMHIASGFCLIILEVWAPFCCQDPSKPGLVNVNNKNLRGCDICSSYLQGCCVDQGASLEDATEGSLAG